MKSCKEISLLTERSQFERLSFGEKMGLWFHKVICSFCKKYSKDSKAINQALKEQVHITTNLTEQERNRIHQNITK